MIPTVEWKNNHVVILDQSALPGDVRFLVCEHYQEVAEAIRELKVRGAPAIGVTAALGIALGARECAETHIEGFLGFMQQVCHALASTRPTAVNLFWAVDRMKRVLANNSRSPIPDMQKRLLEEALAIFDEDIRVNRAIGKFGVSDHSAWRSYSHAL